VTWIALRLCAGLVETQPTIYQAKLRPARLGSRIKTGLGSRFPRLDTLNLARSPRTDLKHRGARMRLGQFRMTLSGIACVAAVATLLAGCSGSSATVSTSPAGATPQPITGIATPSSVSVVTATQ
jgi:hypothetical protein